MKNLKTDILIGINVLHVYSYSLPSSFVPKIPFTSYNTLVVFCKEVKSIAPTKSTTSKTKVSKVVFWTWGMVLSPYSFSTAAGQVQGLYILTCIPKSLEAAITFKILVLRKSGQFYLKVISNIKRLGFHQ